MLVKLLAIFPPRKQVAPRMGRCLFANRAGQFSKKTDGKKLQGSNFYPLSRVPLSLQPPHFVAVAGSAALPIGARLVGVKIPNMSFPYLMHESLTMSYMRFYCSIKKYLCLFFLANQYQAKDGGLAACRIAAQFCNHSKNPRRDFLNAISLNND